MPIVRSALGNQTNLRSGVIVPVLAFALTVVTRNSSIASAFKRSTGVPTALVCASLMSTPSSVMFDWSLRAPAT